MTMTDRDSLWQRVITEEVTMSSLSSHGRTRQSKRKGDARALAWSTDPKPAWQRQVYNAEKDQSRDTPDLVIFGGSYAGTWAIVCTEAQPCLPGFPKPFGSTGGSSLSSPLFAGIQALIHQGPAAKGLPAIQGNAAPTLYALAAQEYGGAAGSPPDTPQQCSADNGATGTGDCVFHNITRGGISANCFDIPVSPDHYFFSPIFTPDCKYYATVDN